MLEEPIKEVKSRREEWDVKNVEERNIVNKKANINYRTLKIKIIRFRD